MRKAVFIYSVELEEYRYPAEHLFNVNRAGKPRSIVNSMGLLSGDNRSETVPTPAERIVLKKFHSARHLHALKTAADGGKVALVLISFRNSKTTVLNRSI